MSQPLATSVAPAREDRSGVQSFSAELRVVSVALLVSALALPAALPDVLGTQGAHTISETISTLLAILVGAVALVHYYSDKNTTLLFVGTAFIGTSLLDGFHGVVTATTVSPLLPSSLGSLSPWSWTASRVLLAVLLLLGWVVWKREILHAGPKISLERQVYVATGTVTVLFFLFFTFVPLPSGYFEWGLVHRPQEFLAGGIFAAAAVAYYGKGNWKTSAFEGWLLIGLLVGALGQLVMMPFSTNNFDYWFRASHNAKTLSYLCVLIGLLFSMARLFRQAVESEATLRRANDELAAFSYSVSHDLRAPIRAMNGFSRMLVRDHLGDANEEMTRLVTKIQAAGDRMGSLIDDLLEFSRLARAPMTIAPIEMSNVVSQVLAEFGDDLAGTLPPIQVQDLPTADGDSALVRQVFQNLIGNAVKFSRGEETPIVEVGMKPTSRGLAYFVRDNGTGFDMEYSNKLYGVFQTLHDRRDYEGTGVGLATVKRIVERHGGEVWAESASGEGATFFFTLTTPH